MRDVEKNRETVRKWYHAHREEYNTKRRAKYAESIGVQNAAKNRSKHYRLQRQHGVIIEREVWKDIGGKRVQVYTTGMVADMLCRTPQTIRNWEHRGWIPSALFKDTHRIYFEHQVMLMKKLNDLIVAHKDRIVGEEAKGQMELMIGYIWIKWTGG